MTRQRNSRQAIAAAAARLMAEDGIDDYATAKRKAARQLGVSDSQALPGNEEIDVELRVYQSLFQDKEQVARLRELRQLAAVVMQDLADFRPYLTGSALKGTAPRYAGIELMVFTDDAKSLELLLLARNISFRHREQRRLVGDQTRALSKLEIDWQGTPITIALFGAKDERAGIRSSMAAQPLERVALPAVQALLDASPN